MRHPHHARPADRVRHPDRLTHPVTGAELTLRRAWPHDDWHVLLEFETPGGGRIAGQWFADAIRRAEVFAATRGALDVPGHGIVLHPDGADRRLTAPAGLVSWPGSRILAHRPEQRAVVRLSGDGDVYYATVVRPGVDAGLGRRLGGLAGLLHGTATLPAVQDWPLGDGVLVLSAVPGPTLAAAGADRSVAAGELAAAWQRLGAALRLLHDAPRVLALTSAGTHDAAAEVTLATRWLRPAAEYGLLQPVDVESVLADLVAGAPGPAGLTCPDVTDAQVVLLPGGGIGLFGLEAVAVGELARGVANLLVRIELRVAQGELTPSRARVARTAVLKGLGPDEATLARVPAYERAARLRLAGEYAFRPRWRGLSRALLTAATP
ncbi:hypothetical protein [Jiangella mangrovi]|uniref:Aminoglycoside phosphotransferase domain-containing protein n=1 Tax=Jiangella mangrovi TaxID=1524084 RepID=A0A7W9LJF3_9ACTN|nr:hypothetical protein [Jiangella mangrovi]MBB5786041.1 hypothetical protein [Jiangella mangrovi]